MHIYKVIYITMATLLIKGFLRRLPDIDGEQYNNCKASKMTKKFISVNITDDSL